MPRSGRAAHAPRRHRRRWPWVLLGILLLVGAFVADAAWAGTKAVSAFRDARDELKAGGDLLLEGDIPGARNAFAIATTRADDADAALGHPAVGIVGMLPWFSDEVDAARRGATAAGYAARGGTAYADAAQAAGWDGGTVPGFAPGGRIDAAVLRAAEPGVVEAAGLLDLAQQELAPVDPATLRAPIAAAIADAKDEIDRRASQAETAARLVDLLPPMLGADGPRTYLLVTLTPSDPRASGGYPGVYGLLHVDGSRLKLTDLAPTSTIPQVAPVEASQDVRRVWGAYGSTTTFWDTTYTPDFPTAADLMTKIWEKGGGVPVDGVIAGDPALMAALLGVVGPVDTPVWPETITRDNVERIVGADTYRTLSQAQSDGWQVGVGAALWQAVFTRPWPMQAMASAVVDAAEGRHLQVWSPNAEEEAILSQLGVAGAVAFPGDGSPLVTLNGFTANRAGYFVTTAVHVERKPTPTGGELITVTIRLTNDAPSGPPSFLLGLTPADTGGGPLGTFGTDVNVYLPQGAVFLRETLDGTPSVPFEDEEFSRAVVSDVVLVPPKGGEATLTFVYGIPPGGGP